MIRFYEDIDVTSRNSFHVRQTAKRLVEFDRAEELPELFAKYGTTDWYVLSGGNNVLFTKDIESLLTKKRLKGKVSKKRGLKIKRSRF